MSEQAAALAQRASGNLEKTVRVVRCETAFRPIRTTFVVRIGRNAVSRPNDFVAAREARRAIFLTEVREKLFFARSILDCT